MKPFLTIIFTCSLVTTAFSQTDFQTQQTAILKQAADYDSAVNIVRKIRIKARRNRSVVTMKYTRPGGHALYKRKHKTIQRRTRKSEIIRFYAADARRFCKIIKINDEYWYVQTTDGQEGGARLLVNRYLTIKKKNDDD